MSITVQSPFKAPPRISATKWMQIITPAFDTPLFNGIPREDRPAVAEGMYLRVVAKGHDPAVWLAIGACEHSLGSNPDSVLHRNDTRSLTNARTVRDPSLSGWKVIRDAVRRSDYVKYQTVVDSLQDGLYRVDEPGYAYRKANAVSIIDHTMIWTEGDGPEYAAKMVRLINEWIDGDATMPVDISGFTPPQIVQQWFAPNGVSYMGESMEMWGVCIHQTGNTSPTSEAQQNVNYMKSPAAINRQASWHATVGLGVVIETIPDNRQAYHGSDDDGPGNRHFFAIEGVMCYPVHTAEFRRVMMNHAWYTAKKLHAKGLPVTPVVQDADWSADVTLAQHNSFARDNKDCPMFYRDNGLWPQFVEYTRAFYAAMDKPTKPATDPNAVMIEHPAYGTHWIINLDTPDGRVEMYRTWKDAGEIGGWGYPLGGMERHLVNGVPVFRQPFENGIGEYYPKGWDGKAKRGFGRLGGIPQNWNWYRTFVERRAA